MYYFFYDKRGKFTDEDKATYKVGNCYAKQFVQLIKAHKTAGLATDHVEYAINRVRFEHGTHAAGWVEH